MDPLLQTLILLGLAVSMTVLFHRLKAPSSLGYLLVGFILGPYATGLVDDAPQIRTLAEFGVVFLLFTIGLSFSLPQIKDFRSDVFSLGFIQVAATTVIVGLLAWVAGFAAASAFVIGAVFAQSSTTIIAKQLQDQSEQDSRHGRLSLAMSVFQDVTAVPFIVVIPVLAISVTPFLLGEMLLWAIVKSVLAFFLVLLSGRWLVKPLFRYIAAKPSIEIFTLTVLLIALIAAWTTSALGLSLAFGAFLAGTVLSETEFRHQIESSIRPFRDILLGLFFVGIGMLIDPRVIVDTWLLAIVGALLLLLIKTVLVALIVRARQIDWRTAWRTGLVLAIGGEFGFALLAIALVGGSIEAEIGQTVLVSVLFSMIAGSFIIRYNGAITNAFGQFFTSRKCKADSSADKQVKIPILRNHVILCGYGRIGQAVAHFLEAESIPYIAIDMDSTLVRNAHGAGDPVYYGDAADRRMLEQLSLNSARLLLISHNDLGSAIKTLEVAKTLRPSLSVLVRTRGQEHVTELQKAGASQVVPETLEAALIIASQALLLLDVSQAKVWRLLQEQRAQRYPLLYQVHSGDLLSEQLESTVTDSICEVPPTSHIIGRPLSDFIPEAIIVKALVREDSQTTTPSLDTNVMSGDKLILHGPTNELEITKRLISSETG
jgi:CPA2 family monovalent cation:H+ antiporter-2